ncbi:MAG: 50S ribosomal protein L25 [Saprospiraceae bacterium]|nr:50S ribosomal protein L25 [Saprospiraceae bacterium]
MEIIALKAHKKESSGKQAAKKVRHSGMVPAIMYKSGGGEAVQFSLNPADFRHLVYSSKFKLAEIELDGAKHKCILKDVQFHPVTDQVVHLDFLSLTPGVKFKASVPLRFAGQAPGVKAGGKFITTLRKINILTTPEKVVDEVVADITSMNLGDTIRVRDIAPEDGVEVTNNGAIPIALIEIPRALKTQ